MFHKIKSLISILLFIPNLHLAQSLPDQLIAYNQAIDHAVIQHDTDLLKKAFTEDFVFYHGTGMVDGKSSWIANAKNMTVHYSLRQHDSVRIEVHPPDIYIAYGKLTVQREDSKGNHRYYLYYQRIFRKIKNRFMMMSHRTLHEVDLL